MTAAEHKWFAAVASLEDCQLCGAQGEQVCHRDFGKGMGLKTNYFETTLLCSKCHRELTDGKEYNRDQKRAFMDRAIVNAFAKLIRRGALRLA